MQLVGCVQDQNDGNFVFDYYAVAVGETDAEGDTANIPIVQVDFLLDGDNHVQQQDVWLQYTNP